jgi:hypothetical protein
MTRFSIPVAEYSDYVPFQSAKIERHKDYLNILYSYSRLKKKMSIFKQLCLPSVINQTSKNWKWYIFISPLLPSDFLNELEICLGKYLNNYIYLHFVDDMHDFLTLSNKILEKCPKPYINCRLDDDDGIHETFVEKMERYSGMEDGNIISFTEVIRTSLNTKNNKIEYHNKLSIPNNAVGLGSLNKNIYKFGNHTNIHEKNTIIYNKTPGMCYQTCDDSCDTKRKLTK